MISSMNLLFWKGTLHWVFKEEPDVDTSTTAGFFIFSEFVRVKVLSWIKVSGSDRTWMRVMVACAGWKSTA